MRGALIATVVIGNQQRELRPHSWVSQNFDLAFIVQTSSLEVASLGDSIISRRGREASAAAGRGRGSLYFSLSSLEPAGQAVGGDGWIGCKSPISLALCPTAE